MVEFVWVKVRPEWLPVAEQEDAERAAMLEAVRNIPEIPAAESVVFDGISIGKRSDAKQASLYDAMMAEILDERNAEKEKARNRRKADRKHNVLPKVRKQMRYDRGWNRYMSMPCYGCKNIGIAEYRMDNAEAVAREDWELESAEIAEYEAEEAIRKFIIAEYDRIEAERKNAEYAERLTEWLKYA